MTLTSCNIVVGGRAMKVDHSTDEIRDLIEQHLTGQYRGVSSLRTVTLNTADGPVEIEAGAIEAVNP